MNHPDAGKGTKAGGRGRRFSRRGILRTATVAATLTMAPRHALGSVGKVAPSEKVNMAFIGTGWQGIWNLQTFLKMPDVRVIAVCDVNEEGAYLGRGQGDL